MPFETKVYVLGSMSQYLYDQYSKRRDEYRRETRKNFSQNEFAQQIGMVPQTFSRYMTGEKSMTMDQATLLLRFFGPEIVEHFDFEHSGALDYDTAKIIALVPRLNDNQKALVVRFLERSAAGEDMGSIEDFLGAGA